MPRQRFAPNEWRREDGTIFRETPERALLVGLDLGSGDIDRSMAELHELAETAGAEPVAVVVQRLDKPHPRTYVGTGKLTELQDICRTEDVEICILNDPVSPLQQRTLERELDVPIVDRVELILDIFAQRARSREGQLQVELAQSSYLLPRLAGRGHILSRLGGGIGTRGPGETAIEVDRRRLRQRISRLNRDIEELKSRRAVERRSREEAGLFTVALVGYTNVGKSTLQNALCGSDSFADDKLFATLDPTVRAMETETGQRVLIADTVGFIERLPPQLVAAFSATLEEVVRADLLAHVVDATDPSMPEKITAVLDVLEDLGALDLPTLTVVNKTDLTTPGQLPSLPEDDDCIHVSALTGQGIDRLRALIERRAAERLRRVTLLLPFSSMGILPEVRRRGRVIEEEYQPTGLRLVADVPPDLANRYRRYLQTKADRPAKSKLAQAG